MVQGQGYNADEAALSSQIWLGHSINRQSDVYRLLGCTRHYPFGFLGTRGKWATVNSECYFKTLIKLKARIACIRSEKKKAFLQHARPHGSLKTTECVTKFGWTMLLYLLYSADLVQSDFHLFEPLKEGLWEKYLVDNNAVIAILKKWTATAGRGFY